MLNALGAGVQMRLLNVGLNASWPEMVPTTLFVPALGIVWLIVSVNVTPDGKFVSGQLARLHDELKVPRSTS